jgi:cytochrome c peroxidase
MPVSISLCEDVAVKLRAAFVVVCAFALALPLGSQSNTSRVPLGLPPLPPSATPADPAVVALGKRLFYDPILSIDQTVSCSSCHDPRFGFADRQRLSTGVGGKHGTRNAPTIANAAYFPLNFWDGRAPNLEKQAEAPVENPVEMAHSLTGVEQRLNADAAWRARFKQAFARDEITYAQVAQALAAFERTLLVANSPFDRWYYGHDEAAMSDSAKRGFDIFRDPARGNCIACHEVGPDYALFTDGKFHNIGIGYVENGWRDEGRYAITHDIADRGAFKTPSLRNVARTAPYMHDGSLLTLDDVMAFYSNGGNPNPNIDPKVHQVGFGLTGREDMIEFLRALTGEVPWQALPLDLPQKNQAY